MRSLLIFPESWHTHVHVYCCHVECGTAQGTYQLRGPATDRGRETTSKGTLCFIRLSLSFIPYAIFTQSLIPSLPLSLRLSSSISPSLPPSLPPSHCPSLSFSFLLSLSISFTLSPPLTPSPSLPPSPFSSLSLSLPLPLYPPLSPLPLYLPLPLPLSSIQNFIRLTLSLYIPSSPSYRPSYLTDPTLAHGLLEWVMDNANGEHTMTLSCRAQILKFKGSRCHAQILNLNLKGSIYMYVVHRF